MIRVCPDCGHYEAVHTAGGNCHGGPAYILCNCIRMAPIEMEPPTEQLGLKVEALESALDPERLQLTAAVQFQDHHPQGEARCECGWRPNIGEPSTTHHEHLMLQVIEAVAPTEPE